MSDQTDGDVYLPTVDGDFLPEAPSELTRKGMFVKMPVMIGWTEEDATRFTPQDKDSREFLHVFFPDLSAATVERILDLYPEEEFREETGAGLSAQFYRSARIMRDILFVCPSFLFGLGMARKYWERNNLIYPPVYLYDFNQTIMDEPGLGVVHSSDLPYVFANIEMYQNGEGVQVHIAEQDHELEKRASRTWSTFASFGVPSLPPETGRETLLDWEGGYGKSDSGNEEGGEDVNVYVIGGPSPGLSQLEEQRLKERCGFLNSDDVIKELRY